MADEYHFEHGVVLAPRDGNHPRYIVRGRMGDETSDYAAVDKIQYEGNAAMLNGRRSTVLFGGIYVEVFPDSGRRVALLHFADPGSE